MNCINASIKQGEMDKPNACIIFLMMSPRSGSALLIRMMF